MRSHISIVNFIDAWFNCDLIFGANLRHDTISDRYNKPMMSFLSEIGVF